MQIISNSTANIKLEITSEDLRHFSDELISRAVNEVAVALKATNEDKLLTREEVKEMCGVCDTTFMALEQAQLPESNQGGKQSKIPLLRREAHLGETNKISGYGKD